MPTEAERNGDFSNSVDQSGRAVSILDTTTGKPFPGNRIPSDQLYAPGIALLKMLPLPNAAGGGHPTYNYVSQVYIDPSPRRPGEDRLQCERQVARVRKLLDIR